jgi:predicted RNA-binding protein with PIN domain
MKRSSHIMRHPYPEPWIANHDGAPVALVDGRNVQRSRWPNLSDDELVRQCCRWARREGIRAVIVFDGGTDASGDDEWCTVVPVHGETADEWLIRITAELRERGVPYWLVTSDRELRALAGTGAERVIGGGGFLKLLGA